MYLSHYIRVSGLYLKPHVQASELRMWLGFSLIAILSISVPLPFPRALAYSGKGSKSYGSFTLYLGAWGFNLLAIRFAKPFSSEVL